jgi:L-fuconolactonase
MDRRSFLRLASAFAVAGATDPFAHSAPQLPVIDCHIHLFDPTRPGGVPWPLKSDTVIYKPAVPARYEKIARPFGIVGAIAVEASPLESDNDWVLGQAAGNPIIVGVVGDLIPGTPSFGRQLDRLHANPLFLGIRYGNLWDRDLSVGMKKPGFIDGLRTMAAGGLSLDSANPDPKLIHALLDLSRQIPDLRIIIDHVPNAVIPAEGAARVAYLSDLKALSQNRNIFIKLSEIPIKQGDHVPTALSFYKERLDTLWDIFGEDHIVFGSDWPNSDHIASFGETFGIVKRYISSKGRVASEKFFFGNSKAAYHWKPRRSDQAVA